MIASPTPLYYKCIIKGYLFLDSAVVKLEDKESAYLKKEKFGDVDNGK